MLVLKLCQISKGQSSNVWFHILGILMYNPTNTTLLRNFTLITEGHFCHDGDVIMGTIGYQITSLPIVYSTIYLDADQRRHQSSASLAFVRGTQRWSVNSPHKWPVTRKMFPFDYVIMIQHRPDRPRYAWYGYGMFLNCIKPHAGVSGNGNDVIFFLWNCPYWLKRNL